MYLISRDIVSGDQRLFSEGQEVLLENISEPTSDYPEAIYVVKSPINGRLYRLNESDLSLLENRNWEAREESCLHQYHKEPDGSLVCSKCGDRIGYEP